MKKIILLFVVVFSTANIIAQNRLSFTVINSHDQQPLPGSSAILLPINKTYIADSSGTIIFENLPNGKYELEISHVGMEVQHVQVTLPQSQALLQVQMEESHENEEAVVISSTRISRSIGNTPTRTEVISGEELMEKANMKPGDIRMLLTESTGIQTQQTSATSFNAGIRIQGLDGRYTQLLRDGYPLYAGFAGSLSILQIAPLDLKQVEVIKGSASTLYGGGAIAGIVNLISKTPEKKKELSFFINGTSAGGIDLSTFYSKRFKKTGLTVFASHNSNRAFDPGSTGFTAIPKFERYTINPRLFVYAGKTVADIGISYVSESRTGGSIQYIKHGSPGFYEKNNTGRITAQVGITHRFNEHFLLQCKNSYSRFNRELSVPAYVFDALQQSTFSELSLGHKGKNADIVIGLNLLTEQLTEQPRTTDLVRNYHNNTAGLFIQHAWNISKKIILESGIRTDYVNDYGIEFLPRISAMFKLHPAITTRIGGGMGYKTPSIFTEDAERVQFRHILPIQKNSTVNERSVGGNWDINYKIKIGQLGIGINQLFFFTKLNRPLVLVSTIDDKLVFRNAAGHLDTRGTETNLRFTYQHFKLFIGYTYTDANTHFFDKRESMPLTARHRLNNVLLYEVEHKIKIGLEAYYFSKQKLNDGTYGRQYWITGFMVEKFRNKFSVFINFENFTNTRQSRFDAIYTGTIQEPVFKDIYAPVEGFVCNGGIKIKI
ncbi:MAG: TonB-dependent receptor [Bacteroidetes bacterium]|nr:TonB-dependent receptor [Bacteroidota bacterium]